MEVSIGIKQTNKQAQNLPKVRTALPGPKDSQSAHHSNTRFTTTVLLPSYGISQDFHHQMNGYRKYSICTVGFAAAMENKVHATIIEGLTQKKSILALDRHEPSHSLFVCDRVPWVPGLPTVAM